MSAGPADRCAPHPADRVGSADRRTVRLIAEYSAFEEIALLCAHLAARDPRFAAVGRRAEDEQFQRKVALEAAGFAVPDPDERTAVIVGRTYQLPDVTASVVRELLTPVALPPPANPDESILVAQPSGKENPMQTTQTTDPNATLNGPQPAESAGFFATVKRYCTVRNGIIAGAVVLVGTAIYCALSGGGQEDVPAVSTTA